jgi:hypothetical protein
LLWTSLVAAPAQAQEPLPEGLYASRQRVTSITRIRPRGQIASVTTTSLVVHEVRKGEGHTIVASRYCSVRQNPFARVRTEMGPAFIDAIPEWESRATVAGPEAGPWDVQVEPHVLILGADLADPAGDELPKKDDDRRVTDPDADGRPGVTIQVHGVAGGEVYMVQRLVRGLNGTLQRDGRMEGFVSGESDQSVVGASNAILKMFTPRFRQDPDPAKSVFDWVPIPHDMTCERLVQAEERLFGEG